MWNFSRYIWWSIFNSFNGLLIIGQLDTWRSWMSLYFWLEANYLSVHGDWIERCQKLMAVAIYTLDPEQWHTSNGLFYPLSYTKCNSFWFSIYLVYTCSSFPTRFLLLNVNVIIRVRSKLVRLELELTFC